MLTFIKTLHTVVWAPVVGCIAGVFVAAHADRLDVAAILIGIVMVEVAVLALNQLPCPLTDMAERCTDEREPNFDIYLPRWLARYNKEIFGPIFGLGILDTLVRWLL
ncbi:MAG: hypothetical protein SGI84_01010 [Gemmatimonadota bacterium]|nr:hypothetical protein [Gemmatimonadota bacterium]